MSGNDVRPTYEVHPVRREVTRRVFKPATKAEINAGKVSLTLEDVTEVEDGFMVYFLNGNSLYLTKKGLVDLGFDNPAMIVHIDSGEIVGQADGSVMRQALLKNAAISRSGRNNLLESEMFHSNLIPANDEGDSA